MPTWTAAKSPIPDTGTTSASLSPRATPVNSSTVPVNLEVGTRRTPITARMNHSNVLKTILEGAAKIGGEVKTTAVTATAAGVIAPLVPAAAAAINP